MTGHTAENGLHRPVPGPQYWDWRCLACGEPVADHPSWRRRLLARVFPPGAQTDRFDTERHTRVIPPAVTEGNTK